MVNGESINNQIVCVSCFRSNEVNNREISLVIKRLDTISKRPETIKTGAIAKDPPLTEIKYSSGAGVISSWKHDQKSASNCQILAKKNLQKLESGSSLSMISS